MLVYYTGPSLPHAFSLLLTARALLRRRRVRRHCGPGAIVRGSARVGRWRLDGTLSKHEERLAASCRARSRRRSYSASALLDGRWLKAEVGQWGVSAAGDGLKLTATA